LEDNTFNSHVHVNLGRDNDGLVVRGTNTFNEVFTVQGGDSRQNSGSDLPNGDASSVAATNVFNKGRFLRRVEASTIATAVTDRIDATTTGLIARAVAADTAAQTLSGLSISATATAAADKSVTSDGVLITKDANVTISGTTLPNATVTLDTDNDGVFDDATTTADATGAYSVQVTLTRKDLYTADATANDQLTGLQTVKVKSSLASGENNTASVVVDLIKSTNSLIKYTTQDKDGKVQEYYLELFNSEAPIAVANFLKYSADGRYEDSIIHRSVDNFVIQGGGFTVEDGIVNAVNTDAAITGEFNAARGNIKGTISMAHTGDPNSGTSQWFLNLKDNADLDDFATKRHTVFGRVVGNGQTVIDAIGALEQVNLQTATSSGALTEVPLRATFVEFARTLTGTIEATANSTQLIGTGTKFLTELKGSTVSGALRSRIQINGQSFFVASISDDTHLTLTAAPATGGTGLTGKTDFAEDDNFVRFSSIVEVLKTT
jgi:cyclophilin family peptidyl-prolyl cis-trans isomerase